MSSFQRTMGLDFLLRMSAVSVFCLPCSPFRATKVRMIHQPHQDDRTASMFLAGAHLAEETRGAGRAGRRVLFRMQVSM